MYFSKFQLLDFGLESESFIYSSTTVGASNQSIVFVNLTVITVSVITDL